MYRVLVAVAWLVWGAANVCLAQPSTPAAENPGEEKGAATGTDRSVGREDGDAVIADAVEPDVIEPDVVSYGEYRDPLIGLNRLVFRFNDVSYRYVLIPAAERWMEWTPASVRDSVARFFDNLRTPSYAVNHLLRLDGGASARALARFAVNSTAGVAGLFDPAAAWLTLERQEARFGDTLEHYGAGYGIYVVVPFAGPSDARGLSGLLLDYYLTPIPYVLEPPGAIAATSADSFQEFAPTAEAYLELARESDDPYVFFRNMHLQGTQRDAEY